MNDTIEWWKVPRFRRLSVFILELSELTHAHYCEPVPLTPDLTKLISICMKNLYFNQSSVFFVFHYLMVNTKPCTISIWSMRRWYFISVKCRSSVTILCFFQISSYSHTLHRVTVSIIRRQITRWRHNHILMSFNFIKLSEELSRTCF